MNKPSRGYFKYILAVDCETTGLFFNVDNPSLDGDKYHMALSWGIIVLEADSLKEVERLYVEIKWDGKSEWNESAAAVHGLTKEHLEKNGITEEEACILIGNLIVKYWATTPVVLLGHNVVTFDLHFLRTMFRRHGIELSFGNRHIDSFSASMITLNALTSDEMFAKVGLPDRELHNALEDILYTVEAVRAIKLLWNNFVDPQLQ